MQQVTPFLVVATLQTFTTDMKSLRLLPAFVASLVLLCLIPSSHAQETIWHVKAIHPDGKLLDVKAFDAAGKPYAIKALQDGTNLHMLDIKALVGEAKLPVKILVSEEPLAPVKAVGADGTIYAIKALTTEGEKLDVKGVSQSGSVISIKAIGPAGALYGIKALSPEGRVYDVKGLKMTKEKVEGKISGVEFSAHIKALPQAP